MKRYRSLFTLFSCQSLKSVLLLILVMMLVQCGMLARSISMEVLDIPWAISDAYLRQIFAGALFALSLLLVGKTIKARKQSGYAMDRLRFSHREIYFCQTIYNACCYILLFAAQVMVLVGFSAFYQLRFPENCNHQTIMLAAYQHDFFHVMLPLADVLCWFDNFLIIVLCGLYTAAYHKRTPMLNWLAAPTIYIFGRYFLQGRYPDPDPAIYAIPAAVLLMVIVICLTLKKEVSEYD